MTDYEQMEMDMTLESDRDLKENMQTAAKIDMKGMALWQRDIQHCRGK